MAERFFVNSRVSHFLLEYDTPRAGDFKPLRFVPKDKGVVLGLVSTKTPVLEPLDDLKRRVGEAAKHIELGRLGIGPQCGFASTAAGNPADRSRSTRQASARRRRSPGHLGLRTGRVMKKSSAARVWIQLVA